MIADAVLGLSPRNLLIHATTMMMALAAGEVSLTHWIRDNRPTP